MGVIVFLAWIILAFMVANAGDKRNIGYGTALAMSIIFSPIIGLLFVAVSEKKKSRPASKWRIDYERAKKAEFLGDKSEAEKYYKSALYELKNDKRKLSRDGQRKRLDKIYDLNAKLRKLQQD